MPDVATGREGLRVGIGTAAHERAAVSTSFSVRRWDAEQTQWADLRWRRHAAELPPGWEPTHVHFDKLGVETYLETREDDCNLIVSTGWAMILGGIAGTPPTHQFSATYGRLGVGNSSTAAASTQTYLVGDTGGASTTSYYKTLSGAPAINTGIIPATLTLTAAFGAGVANFSWNEFGTDNYNSDSVTAQGNGASAIFFNRGVSAQGTKASGQTWTATETISFGYPSGSGSLGTT